MTDDQTQPCTGTYPPGMTALDRAVAAQQRVADLDAQRRAALAARDTAVCEAWRSGEAGRTAIARCLGMSVSTVDHILDPRRTGTACA